MLKYGKVVVLILRDSVSFYIDNFSQCTGNGKLRGIRNHQMEECRYRQLW